MGFYIPVDWPQGRIGKPLPPSPPRRPPRGPGLLARIGACVAAMLPTGRPSALAVVKARRTAIIRRPL
ncbi:hypothetical protein [Aquamicrobium terrae]|uniref:Uncharacterized protein n=1 Tax=Aquamicrobium terrae TaxID=1324945 RepID=A0ABV2MY29_9HYPH